MSFHESNRAPFDRAAEDAVNVLFNGLIFRQGPEYLSASLDAQIMIGVLSNPESHMAAGNLMVDVLKQLGSPSHILEDKTAFEVERFYKDHFHPVEKFKRHPIDPEMTTIGSVYSGKKEGEYSWVKNDKGIISIS